MEWGCVSPVYRGEVWGCRGEACLQRLACLVLSLQELRERVLRGKYRVPFYMSTDCESILRRFLVLNPAKRCTLEVSPSPAPSGPFLSPHPCPSIHAAWGWAPALRGARQQRGGCWAVPAMSVIKLMNS